jgi:hypothetical protein
VQEEKESRGERPARLGRVEEKTAAGLGLAGRKRKKREGRCWAGPRGEKETERRNCIQMHCNLNLKFKFKWKTSNEIMQYGMKCTRSIFPYIFLRLSKLLLIHDKCSKIKIIE